MRKKGYVLAEEEMAEDLRNFDYATLHETMDIWVPRPVLGHQFKMHVRPGCYVLNRPLKAESLPNPERLIFESDQVLNFRDPRRDVIHDQIRKFWKMGPKLEERGLLHKRGILIYGPPGSGKSTILRQEVNQLVDEDHVVFVSKSPYTLTESISAFRKMEPTRPLTILMEDIDEIVSSWGVHELLEMLDGMNTANHVLVLATTNNAEKIPAKLRRPGRLDKKIEVPNPGFRQRFEYLNNKVGDLLTEEGVKKIARASKGMGFGHLREITVMMTGYGTSLTEAIESVNDDKLAKVNDGGINNVYCKDSESSY